MGTVPISNTPTSVVFLHTGQKSTVFELYVIGSFHADSNLNDTFRVFMKRGSNAGVWTELHSDCCQNQAHTYQH